MPRIQPVHLEEANEKAKPLLDGVRKKMGKVPNLLRTLAHSPAALESYLGFSQALGGGRLSPKLREQIAMAVGRANGCDYCQAAHALFGAKAGLDEAELRRNAKGESSDPKAAVVLNFAVAVVRERGWVSDDQVERLRSAGYGDAEIIEIVATIALNLFTNYANHVFQTEVDFPAFDAA